MNKFLAGVVLFMMPFFFSSCSVKMFGKKRHRTKDTATAMVNADTTKPAPVFLNADTVAVATLAKPVASSARLIEELTPIFTKRLSYNTFSGKAKVNFDGPSGSLDLTANFRVKKDSVIWVHITALGGMVSAARIFVTRDSFFMLNYQQKEVTRIALKDAAKTLPTSVDFNQLQNLIIGEPLRDGTITDADSIAAAWNINVADSSYIQHITYAKRDSTMSAGQMTTIKPAGPRAMIDYSDYKTVDGRKISTGRKIRVENGAKIYDIDMNFVNEDFDKELEYPFWVPRNYTLKNPQ